MRVLSDGGEDGELVRARVDAELIAEMVGNRRVYRKVAFKGRKLANVVDALLELSDEARRDGHWLNALQL